MNKTILLVDDDDAFRDAVKDILELEGFKIICAENGKTALTELDNENLDLVITDILMPESDGIELISKIKELRSDLKVIGMTGGGTIASANKLKTSFSGFYFETILTKPFEDSELLEAINKAIT
ncbi:MAG: hypothetical protein COA79_00865 [Planctomycetota bacterium]|nr:MAG: hypothetical protein COA79_00865 [Planctomycetota bacterium]